MTSAPRDIRELELCRDELNIFVLGPGYGEAIVVALPHSGWLVLDGAGRPRQQEYPVHDLLEAHLGNDAIELLVLTHPHLDHYRGMRELIEHKTLGPRIRRIACVSELVDGPKSRNSSSHGFGVEMEAHGILAEIGRARALLERIQTFWDVDRPRRRVPLVEGPVGLVNGAVHARVLGPTQTELDEFFAPMGRSRRLREQANQLSAVIELRFGELPHHGSENALPPALLEARTSGGRFWALTPFNRGKKADRPPSASGLSTLLEYEREVYVTAFPVAWTQTTPAPARVSLGELDVAPVRLRTKPPQGTLIRRRVERELRQRDCYWLFSFDRSGRMTRSARGAASTRVVRDEG